MAAVQDLPDPLDKPAAAAPQSPDDLLSQMADDAIDKLIAEAEAATAAAPVVEPPPAAPVVDATLQAVLTAADATPPVAAVPSAKPPHEAAPEVSHDVEPTAPADHPPGPAADVQALLAADAKIPNEKTPLLLKPLELLSTPLTNADDKFRTAVGQIAILTLINAIAVLIYVLVVRGK